MFQTINCIQVIDATVEKKLKRTFYTSLKFLKKIIASILYTNNRCNFTQKRFNHVF